MDTEKLGMTSHDEGLGIGDYFNDAPTTDAPANEEAFDKAFTGDQPTVKVDPVKETTVVAKDLPPAKPKQSFKEAFAAAQDEYKNKGVDTPFEWNGKKYSRLTAEQAAAKKSKPAVESKPAPSKPAPMAETKAPAAAVKRTNVNRNMPAEPTKAPAEVKPAAPKKQMREQNTVMDQAAARKGGLYGDARKEFSDFFNGLDDKLSGMAKS